MSRYSAPPRGLHRLLIAYRVTVAVVLSYLVVRLRLRFRSGPQAAQLLRAAHRSNARRIHQAIERLGGLFIKVGQLISIMTNLLPEEFRLQLTTLQDRVPPRPYADIERRFIEEFAGYRPREIFAEFSEEPVASASIGQVHRARTRDGLEVAVKVQYPDIEAIVRIDLRALGRIFQLLHWLAPYHGLDAVFVELRAMMLTELDFAMEARNLDRIAAGFLQQAPPLPVACPKVQPELSTARILTTTWIDGVKVNNLPRLRELGIDCSALARVIVTAYCQQIFRDGVYHADPHPGNLLVVPAASAPPPDALASPPEAPSAGPFPEFSPSSPPPPGPISLGGARVVFLDFGAVAELSPTMRHGIVEILQAGLTRDTPRLIVAMKDMGFISRGADPEIFERVIDFFHDKFQAEVNLESLSLRELRLSPEKALADLADLRRLNVSLRDLMDHFHVPKEWILLERTLLLLLGLCTELDPALNPMQVIRPYIEEMVLGQDRDWSKFIVETTRDVVTHAAQLPGELRKFLGRAQRGQLEVRYRPVPGPSDSARLIYSLGHQLIFAAFTITALAGWLVLDGRQEPERAAWALYAAGGCGAALVLSMLTTSSRKKRRDGPGPPL
jgi:predicted unusual protein kinase regulating ubiquinone biosynthesis (AarF/ABC1/UbiB family)